MRFNLNQSTYVCYSKNPWRRYELRGSIAKIRSTSDILEAGSKAIELDDDIFLWGISEKNLDCYFYLLHSHRNMAVVVA